MKSKAHTHRLTATTARGATVTVNLTTVQFCRAVAGWTEAEERVEVLDLSGDRFEVPLSELMVIEEAA